MTADRSSSFPFLRVLAAALILAVLLNSAPAQALDQTAESAALAGHWAAVVARLRPRTERGTQVDAVERFVLAHALLALNHNNEAVCAFETLTDAKAVEAWRRWAEAAVATHPQRAFAHYALGDAAARRLDWPAALAAFDAGTKLQDGTVAPLLADAGGAALARSGKTDAALVTLYDAAAAHPKSTDLHASYGVLSVTAGDGPLGALKAFDKALAIDRNFALAHNGRAAALFALGRWEEAARELVAAGKATPNCLHQPQANAEQLAKAMLEIENRNLTALAAKYGTRLDILDKTTAISQLPREQAQKEMQKMTPPEREVASQILSDKAGWDRGSAQVFRALSGLDVTFRSVGIKFGSGFADLANRDDARARSYQDLSNQARGIGQNSRSSNDVGGVTAAEIQRTFVDSGNIKFSTRYSLNYGAEPAPAAVTAK